VRLGTLLVLSLLALVAPLAHAQPRAELPAYAVGDRWLHSDGAWDLVRIQGENRDGIVMLQEVCEYVEQQVTRKARSVGGNQHPVMKGELEGVLPLAKVRSR
jgi:hypothetical protein